MIVYTVHEPPNPQPDRIERADSLLFVRDGFSWAAAVFGPFWMLANGLWIVALVYIVGTFVLGLVLGLVGIASGWGGLLAVALNVLVGFEASSLRRWTLERRGWQMVGTVTGRNRPECERRFFEAWLPGEPVIRPSIETVRSMRTAAASAMPMSRLTDGVG